MKRVENSRKYVLVTLFTCFQLLSCVYMRYRPLSIASRPLNASPSASTCFWAWPLIFNCFYLFPTVFTYSLSILPISDCLYMFSYFNPNPSVTTYFHSFSAIFDHFHPFFIMLNRISSPSTIVTHFRLPLFIFNHFRWFTITLTHFIWFSSYIHKYDLVFNCYCWGYTRCDSHT